MTESELAYFQRRAAEERAAAERAGHPLARRSHLELAQRFDVLAASTQGDPVVQMPVPPSRSNGQG